MGNFVFLCCEENENKSNLITTLDTYRVRQFEKNIKTEEQLKKKLRPKQQSAGSSQINASAVDTQGYIAINILNGIPYDDPTII